MRIAGVKCRKNRVFEQFKDVLVNNRNLSKKAVNYWCLELGLDRDKTRAFRQKSIWLPLR